MAQDRIKDRNENKQQTSETYKSRIKKEKSYQSKVIVRRLPPTMNEEQFLDQISPVPNHDYFYFVKGDLSLGQHAFSRAYLNFTHQDEIYIFKEKFDGYVFLDAKGNEYTALVEFAPFQKIPKKRNKKRDAKCDTIETDVDYLNFLESLKNPENVTLPTTENYLEEIETREKELKSNNGVPKCTTPLIEYLKQRKIEQQKIRDEKREERKRKEIEKKRQREEERRRRKAEKERKEKAQKESQSTDKDAAEDEDAAINEDTKASTDPVVQVLKNPEREKENLKEQAAPKTKEFTGSHGKDKKDWEGDRGDKGRTKDRYKAEKGYRTRGEKSEFKSAAKGSTESKSKGPNLVESKESGRAPASKIKRDKSCPGNIENLGKENQLIDYDCQKELSDPCQDSSEHQRNSDDGNKGVKDNKDTSKDPRVERKIKNKDRPSLEIYRPGMRRFSAQRNSPQKEVVTSPSNSSTPSPSPTPPLTSIGAKSSAKEISDVDKSTPPSNDENTDQS